MAVGLTPMQEANYAMIVCILPADGEASVIFNTHLAHR